MMAFGRALGETMAVMMVIGNSPIYPKLLGRGQTLPALTALEMGSIEYGSLHLSVLTLQMLCACDLFHRTRYQLSSEKEACHP